MIFSTVHHLPTFLVYWMDDKKYMLQVWERQNKKDILDPCQYFPLLQKLFKDSRYMII